MWSPTHVQVLVKRAKGLKVKGKDGSNDAFVTIALGKEKYQTSVKEKATDLVEWCEQCELTIPAQGNTAEIVLTALHRNFLGVDEFLGLVVIPLRDFDVYDRPRTKWYPLRCKPGQSKNEYRGDLEVRTAFTVKAVDKDGVGSTADLSSKSKHKGSLQSLNKAASNFGGSLLAIGQKEKKQLKRIAKSVTHKVEKVGEKAKKNLSKSSSRGDEDSPTNKSDREKLDNSLNRFSDPFAKIKGAPSRSPQIRAGNRRFGGRNLDPGVNSDDEDGGLEAGGRLDDDDMFRFDALSQGSSGSSLNVSKVDPIGIVSKTSTPLSGSLENLGGGELLRKTATPVGARKSFAPQQESPLVQSTPINKSLTPKLPTTEDMDEWELKLLGKKGVPYLSPSINSSRNLSGDKSRNQRDNISTFSLSLNSGNGSQTSSRTNTLERPTKLERPYLNVSQHTPFTHKKIIPVQSDFESSPSPEDCPSSPRFEDTQSFGSPFAAKEDKTTAKSSDQNGKNEVGDQPERKKGIFGKMGKTSMSFRSDKEQTKDKNSSSRLKISTESLIKYGHSRTCSDGSAGSVASSGVPPPNGPRVVLGRETTPTTGSPNSSSYANGEGQWKVPREVMDRFEGKSREDLIEMVVSLQTTIEAQARKQSDLEDYIDSLLMKVLSTAPNLLQKKPNGTAGKNDAALYSNAEKTPSFTNLVKGKLTAWKVKGS